MDLCKERSLSVEKLKSAGKRLRTHRLFQDPFILFLIITSLVVVTVFIIYPLFCILKTSIYYKGVFSLETFKSTLATSGFKVAFWNSMKLGFGSAITSTLVGFIFAYQEAYVASRLKPLYSIVSLMPVISPPFVLSLSAILLLGKRGLITYSLLHITNANIYGYGGLILVQTLAFSRYRP